jgi:hypothetical protein
MGGPKMIGLYFIRDALIMGAMASSAKIKAAKKIIT